MLARHLQFKCHPTTTIAHQRSKLFKSFHSPAHRRQLLDQMPQRSVASLNSSMLTCVHRNRQPEAISIFREQVKWGFVNKVDEVTIAVALKACRGDPRLGLQIHGFAVSSGFVSYSTVSNSLMNMYCKCGKFSRALEIFEKLSDPDTVSWNTILSGFQSSEGAIDFSLRMNRSGVIFDAVTYTTILSFCSDHQEFLFGFQLHSLVLKYGLGCEVFVGNALITMYSRWGHMFDAMRVFDEMPNRDLVSWNAILSGFAQEGYYAPEAIFAFIEMVRDGMRLDHVSFTSAVSACGYERNINLGKQVHGLTIKEAYGTHVSVCNVLISLYSKCEAVEDAKLVFKSMVDRNVVSWTTMISMSEEESVCLFNEMRMDGVYPNDVTFVGLLHAISIRNLADVGGMVHGFCVKGSFLSELTVCNSFISMYAKFGAVGDSVKIFDELNYKDIISWNALISGYVQNELYQEALQAFFSTVMNNEPNHFTFGSVLSAIGAAEAIPMRHGQRCHSQIAKLGLDANPIVSGALLDMYSKRGSICESHKVFSEAPQRGLVAWTAIISAYSRHGDYESVMNLFEEMEKEQITPDSITFLAILTACGRKGMVDMGRHMFDRMVQEYHIQPSPEHYSCMVDMLGRAGRLKEAGEFVVQIPGGPGLSVLQSLLGSCRIHGNVEMAKRVADALIEMEPMASGSYVLMSNMYAENEEWFKVANVRRKMRNMGVKKEIGFSWVDAGDAEDSLLMHGFSSDDKTHPRSEEIYWMATRLGSEMKFLERERERQHNCNIISGGQEQQPLHFLGIHPCI